MGVTAVELLPVQQFDPQSVSQRNPFTGEPLTNYWGYEPDRLFCAAPGLQLPGNYRCAVDEFREMVKALHRAGIEVILEWSLTTRPKGTADGPTISFRGLENRAYYIAGA